jgi:hypothetical protein
LNGEDLVEDPGPDNEMSVGSTSTAATPGATIGATWNRHHPPTAEELEPRTSNITTEISPVLTQAAAVAAQQTYAREVIRRRQEEARIAWYLDRQASLDASAVEASDAARARFRHAGQDHPRVPLRYLRPPQSWTPCRFDVLVVTRKWRDVVWLWNESVSESHQGMGLLTMQWLVGPAPHFVPAIDDHVMITDICWDEAGMAQLQMASIVPSGWFGGRGIWFLRYLHGM